MLKAAQQGGAYALVDSNFNDRNLKELGQYAANRRRLSLPFAYVGVVVAAKCHVRAHWCAVACACTAMWDVACHHHRSHLRFARAPRLAVSTTVDLLTLVVVVFGMA